MMVVVVVEVAVKVGVWGCWRREKWRRNAEV
jgi:hypothetical protein